MNGPAPRSSRVSARPAGAPGDPGVLVRVLIGQTPRDTSAEDGPIVRVDAETAEHLIERGDGAIVADRPALRRTTRVPA